jgi:two-component system chemotaxis sensor kinase CheA
MAHSIKSMAASLEYDSITELAHALEDRMERARSAGRVASSSELVPLFEGLEGLEAMVQAVRRNGETPAHEPALVERVRGVPPEPAPATGAAPPDRLKKKLLT